MVQCSVICWRYLFPQNHDPNRHFDTWFLGGDHLRTIFLAYLIPDDGKLPKKTHAHKFVDIRRILYTDVVGVYCGVFSYSDEVESSLLIYFLQWKKLATRLVQMTTAVTRMILRNCHATKRRCNRQLNPLPSRLCLAVMQRTASQRPFSRLRLLLASHSWMSKKLRLKRLQQRPVLSKAARELFAQAVSHGAHDYELTVYVFSFMNKIADVVLSSKKA